MDYEPREGVDYLVDLYAVSGALQDAEQDEIKRQINERRMEYHPDRLQGLAPEFQARGERMAKLLNRANKILLDDDARREYDEILAEWDGPVSKDGTPAMTMERLLQVQIAGNTPDEVESAFGSLVHDLHAMTNYNPQRVTNVESIIQTLTAANLEIPAAVKADYEDALLQEDRVLAVEESHRSKALGLPRIENNQYRVTAGYQEAIAAHIENARLERLEQLRMAALGGVSTRLAILAGEASDQAAEPGALLPAGEYQLPAYFEDQAHKVSDIARRREALTQKRLDILEPAYPEAELQDAFREEIILLVGDKTVLGARFTLEDSSLDIVDIPDAISHLLKTQDYRAIIAEGYAILAIGNPDHLTLQDIVVTAISKYQHRYSL